MTVTTGMSIFGKISFGVVRPALPLRKIDLELDSGATVDVRAGLKPGDHVILKPAHEYRQRHSGPGGVRSGIVKLVKTRFFAPVSRVSNDAPSPVRFWAPNEAYKHIART